MNFKPLMLAAACGLLAASTGALAAPAIYRDNVMTIDSGAMINGNTQEYYSDIKLSADANGKLKILAAKKLPLVYIDDVEAEVVENNNQRSVTLTITGNKSVPCVDLKEPAVSYKNGVFTVLVAETLMGPAESCVAMLSPFEVEVELDVSALNSGTYAVKVNGEDGSFKLNTNRPAN
jgi:hypothetical protein